MAAVSSRKKARIEKEAVHIPEDVTVEILKRLPGKSLLRFRCVGKTWYSLISDPGFCNKFHQKRSCLLICSSKPKRFSTVAIESFLMNGKTPILSTPISLPWQGRRSSKFLGSCKGLVCVEYRIIPDRNSRSSLILWNPSTGKFKELPSTSLIRNNCMNLNIYDGFGYDESVDDYKFVSMFCRRSSITFDVFSLKSNTWRIYYQQWKFPDIMLSDMTRYHHHPKFSGVLYNGAIHWVVRCKDGSSFRILALDLASNKFRQLDNPKERGNAAAIKSYLVSLSGFPCLCVHHILEGSRVDLWMRKEHGASPFWLKLISVPTKLSILTFYPILFSHEEGKIVAVVRYLTWSGRYSEVCEIMRLQVGKGSLGVVDKAETLLFEDVSSNVFDDYALLDMEETSVSLN